MNQRTETECRFCAEQIDGEPCEKVNRCRRDVRVCESYVAAKTIYLKLPPEIVDGEHWTVVDNTGAALEAMKTWCDEFLDYPDPGESITIELVEMTLAEVDALPDI